jgi:hypothetical protein
MNTIRGGGDQQQRQQTKASQSHRTVATATTWSSISPVPFLVRANNQRYWNTICNRRAACVGPVDLSLSCGGCSILQLLQKIQSPSSWRLATDCCHSSTHPSLSGVRARQESGTGPFQRRPWSTAARKSSRRRRPHDHHHHHPKRRRRPACRHGSDIIRRRKTDHDNDDYDAE